MLIQRVDLVLKGILFYISILTAIHFVHFTTGFDAEEGKKVMSNVITVLEKTYEVTFQAQETDFQGDISLDISEIDFHSDAANKCSEYELPQECYAVFVSSFPLFNASLFEDIFSDLSLPPPQIAFFS